jgi:hypothetical protein
MINRMTKIKMAHLSNGINSYKKDWNKVEREKCGRQRDNGMLFIPQPTP